MMIIEAILATVVALAGLCLSLWVLLTLITDAIRAYNLLRYGDPWGNLPEWLAAIIDLF